MPKKMGRRGRKAGSGQTRHAKDVNGSAVLRSVPDIHQFVRRDVQPLTIGALGVGVGFGFSFSLANLPNFADFTSLFDSYRIDRIDANVIGGSNTLQLYAAVDYDDAVAPLGAFEMLERQNVQVKSIIPAGINQSRISFVPRMPMEGSSGPGPLMAPIGTWIDAADTSVQYFGIKYFVQPLVGTVNLQAQVIFTYHLSFRAAK